MNLRKIVGDNIKGLRKKMEWSQEDLALEANVERAYLGRIERSEFSVSVDTLEKIARALKVKPHLLLVPRAHVGGAQLED